MACLKSFFFKFHNRLFCVFYLMRNQCYWRIQMLKNFFELQRQVLYRARKPRTSWNFVLTFPRTGKSWIMSIGPVFVQSLGNLFNSFTSNKVFRIYAIWNVCRPLRELIWKSWEWKGLSQNLEIWILEKFWKNPWNLFLKKVWTLEREVAYEININNFSWLLFDVFLVT